MTTLDNGEAWIQAAIAMRFSIDGEEPCSLDDFREANEECEGVEDWTIAMADMKVGQMIALDLGAGGLTTIKRVS